MNYLLKDLHEYIKSLTTAEKRYFVFFCKAFITDEAEPFYLQVFAGLAFNDFELPQSTKGMSPQAFTSAKRKIQEKLGETLLYFHKDSSIEIQVRNLLSKAEILSYRIPDQANLLVQKALEITRANELFGGTVDALSLERRIHGLLNKPYRLMTEIIQEEHDLTSRLNQIRDLEILFYRAKDFKKSYGYIKGDLMFELEDQILKAIPIRSAKECLSKKSLYYYNFIHALYYWMIRDHMKAYFFSRELLQQEIQMVIPNEYLDGILEHTTACVCIGKFGDALNSIKVAIAYLEKLSHTLSHNGLIKIYYYQVCYQLIIHNYTGNKALLQEALLEGEGKLLFYKKDLSIEARQVILGNMLNAYIGLGDFKRADLLWDQLFTKKSKATRRDIYDNLYLFRIFSLLQSETYAVIASHALSSYRYYHKFKDHQTHFEVEIKICLLLKKEHDFTNLTIRKELLLKIKAILETYIQKISNGIEFSEQYTFYLIWTDSLLTGNPFHLCATLWHQRFQSYTQKRILS